MFLVHESIVYFLTTNYFFWKYVATENVDPMVRPAENYWGTGQDKLQTTQSHLWHINIHSLLLTYTAAKTTALIRVHWTLAIILTDLWFINTNRNKRV